MTSIHISDIRTFRTCRRKWDWSSPLRRNLEPSIPYAPFYTGRAFHAALEFYYRDGVPLDNTVEKFMATEKEFMDQVGEMWPMELEVLAEQTELIKSIVHHYKLWQEADNGTYCDKNLQFVALEMEFEIPLPTPEGYPDLGLTFGGRFDGVVRHIPSNTLWIWETKTTRSVAELTGSLVNDEQCGAYMHAASQVLNEPVVGVLYNICRKKEPSVPNMLKNGSLSKAKSIDTTPMMYLEEVRATFPDYTPETIEEEYGDILAALKENTPKFFLRFPVYRSRTEIQGLMQNVYHTAAEMVNPDTVTYPAPGWMSCKFCSFKSACLTKNAGGDFETLLDAEFVTRTSNKSMKSEVNDGEV